MLREHTEESWMTAAGKIANASSVKNTCKRGLYIVERSGSVWGGCPALRTEEQRGSENQHCAFSNILKGRREERAKPLAEGEKATRETLSLGTWLEQSLDVIAKKPLLSQLLGGLRPSGKLHSQEVQKKCPKSTQ